MPGSASLPLRGLKAVIFDMDGVITQTASVHAAAWKRTFDGFLAARAGPGASFRPFDDADYLRYVDGKPRYDGVAAFLASRGISLPWGSPEDPAGYDSVCAIGNKKDLYFAEALESQPVRVFESTIDFIRRLKDEGIAVGVFSASRHAREVLQKAGVLSLFDARVDGTDAAGLGLPGKPDPATLVELARRLGARPAECAVVEDAIAGVQAGRAGGFAAVIGINRSGPPGFLREAGATIEVRDLSELEMSR
ncbi:MAG TPA: beta-phosphoglucomutase family hydrolase [Dehalococcoidia bacterium]|nr:beta-phosphoglucomutase family hydrolase [Dehalococcoidia bacterium]